MKLENLSIRDIEDFKGSPVWQVVLGDLNDMRKGILFDMEEAPMDDVIITDEEGKVNIVKGVRKLQGAISVLKHILNLPDMMVAELKSMEDIKDERGEEGDDPGDTEA